MFAMNLGKLNINEAELKAFIYQQINDMQPYIGDGTIAIKMAYTDAGRFIVKVISENDAGAIEAESVGEDLFNAISQAKVAFIKHMSSIEPALSIGDIEPSVIVTTEIEKKTIH